MMMEVQQRLACLSPTQRLSAHPPASSLRQLPTSPLSLPRPAVSSTPSLPSGMIIEASLHSSAATPPDSPQQGETVPSGVSEDPETNFSMLDEAQREKGLPHPFPAQPTEAHPLWGQGSELASSMEEFSQGGMAREGVEEEGSASPPPQQQSPIEHDAAPAPEAAEHALGSEGCYTPPHVNAAAAAAAAAAAPSMPGGSQEPGDRRNRRKQTLEDIVRRIVPSEPDDAYHSEDAAEEADARMDMVVNRSHVTDDEVDGAPLEISRQILNAQACAESAIKQSLLERYEEGEDMEQEADGPGSGYAPVHFLHPSRKDPQDPKKAPEHPWDESKVAPLDFDYDGAPGEKKPGVTILPKTSLPSHMAPSLAGGLHSSLPMSSNISETAYSPHHFSTAKMGNGWFPGGMPHLFPFSPAGLMDHPMGPKFLPFESKMIADVDKDYLKCNYCERTFRRQKNLENHIENTHQGKGGQRPKREVGDMYFKCTHCPYTTKHQSNLYVHLRIHTGERPYICGACGVQYSQSHSLKSHIINKHDGQMNFYIKEKRNRSPRGLGYMSTHVSPGDQTIFKMPPPPALPNMQQSNMELVARAIEMAKNSMGEGQGPPPHLLHPQSIPSSMHQHSPLMSPNGPLSGPHGLFSKPGPGFPFNGHFGTPGMPFGDLPATPTPALIPQPSPGSHLPNGSTVSPNNNNNNNNNTNNNSGSSGGGGGGSGRNELLNLSTSSLGTPTSTPSFSASSNPNLLSPGSAGKPLPSPNGQHAPNNNNKAAAVDTDCGAMDLSTRGGAGGAPADAKARLAAASNQEGRCSAYVKCLHGNKLKLLRLNVVRMLSILVPNLNFEEKGISADSDSVDDLLQDVIESNTHDDDMVH